MKAPRSRSPHPKSEVRAATVALQGVQREAAGGQRTTVDVLNAQQDLILAKARLIGAQRDRVIASYTLLSAIGRLDVKTSASTRRIICRKCTIIRCATPGTACGRRRGSRSSFVIPGRCGSIEPGIHRAARYAGNWIPGLVLRTIPE